MQLDSTQEWSGFEHGREEGRLRFREGRRGEKKEKK
jgi:hypothetical protein